MNTVPAVGGTAPDLLQRLRETARQIEIDDVTYYVVEGDTLLDEDQLAFYAEQQTALRKAREAARLAREAGMMPLVGMTEPGAELVGILRSKRIVRWGPGVELSYCVLRPTFAIGGQPGYDLAVEAMDKATEAWEAACGVSFVHKEELDESTTTHPDGVLFTVREIAAGGMFIAAAFFPTDPTYRRRVLIDPSYYEPDLGFDKVGVLRHELGHVLGFRHEQIRSEAPPGCPDEDTYGTINLSDYDPRSVMHYFCGGVGDPDLKITPTDEASAQKVYGPPLGGFLFVE